jgi:hypothetical protein
MYLKDLASNLEMHAVVCMYVCMYVFVGAGFPMHCNLIWSIVRPLWIFKQLPCLHTGPAH